MLLSTLENILDIPGSVQDTHNFNPAGDCSVENDVSAKGKTLNSRSQLLPTTSRARLAAEHFHCLVEFVDKGVGIRHAVIRNVAPNLGEIFACPRADAGHGHLFRALRRFLLAGDALDFFWVEDGGRSAVQAFLYVLAEFLHLQGSQLIFLLEETQRLADDFASGVIGPGGDLLADHFLKVGSKADIHGHEGKPRKQGNSENSADDKICQSLPMRLNDRRQSENRGFEEESKTPHL